MSLVASSRSELTKQFTTSAWWILALILVLYVGSVAAAIAWATSAVATGALPGANAPDIPDDAIPPVVYSIATSIGYVFPLLIGTLMVTSEFRHKTLTPTFLATPRRGLALSAKVVIGIVMGLIFGAIGIAAAVAPGAALLGVFGVPPGLDSADTWALLGRMLIASVIWTLLGIGVGALVRNQVVAVVLVLAFTQFIEPIARVGGSFLPGLEPVVRLLPGAASDALVGASAFALTGPAASDPLEWWAGGAVLLAYALVVLVLGLFTSWRRDVN